MKTEQFNTIIEEQQKRCVDILVNKAKEYATEDRLHNFKVAAELQMTTPIMLAGMRQTHSQSTICRSVKDYQRNVDEITDHINCCFY